MWNYQQRATSCSHPVNQQLLSTMLAKQTNLGLVADVTSSAELLALAEQLGPHICLFKTHIDIVEDISQQTITALQQLAEQHQFVLFEDRKFGDIGNTVKHQYSGGPFQIASWSKLTTVFATPGPGIIDGMREAATEHHNGLLLLAQLSSQGALTNATYQQATVELAQKNPDVVSGFICQQRPLDDPNFVYITPGVKLAAGKDSLGQQYRTPEDAIAKQGCDIILVGRGILHSEDRLATTQAYQAAGWEAYLLRG